MHDAVPFDKKLFVGFVDIAKIADPHLLKFSLQMSYVVFAVGFLAIVADFSKYIYRVKVLSLLFLILLAKFAEDIHEDISYPIFVIQIEKVFLGFDYF